MVPLYSNGSAKEWMDFLYPFADTESGADFGDGNTGTFYLCCEILANDTVTDYQLTQLSFTNWPTINP
jgi:hypothetical protein